MHHRQRENLCIIRFIKPKRIKIIINQKAQNRNQERKKAVSKKNNDEAQSKNTIRNYNGTNRNPDNNTRLFNNRNGRNIERSSYSHHRSQAFTDAPSKFEKENNYREKEFMNQNNSDMQELNDRILCGRNPIREAFRSNREIEKLLVQKGELSGSAREIIKEARDRKILVQEVDKKRLDEIVSHHQGLVAFTSAYQYATVEDMLVKAEQKNEDPFLIILDGVTDPHNLGAIIRTAECVGAHGVIIPIHRCVGLTPSAIKASAGAIEHMSVAKVMNLNRTIDELKKKGIWTYAVTMNGKDYEKVNFKGGVALIIGSEGEGISRLTSEKCDMSVSLPMCGELESLNASVAAGVIMYRVLSCRRKN